MKYACGLFFLLIFCTLCKGQGKPDVAKEDVKSEAKDVNTFTVPAGTVRTIKQDRKGNIWITSWGQGVLRYDGKSFTNVTSGVSSARFFSILEDRKGNMWFGSEGSGVYRYDGKSFENFTTKEGLVNNVVNCIYEDKAGNIWFGTRGGASRYDGKSFRNYIIDKDSMYEDSTGKTSTSGVSPIIEDKSGKFWFGIHGNVIVYDGETFTTLLSRDPGTLWKRWGVPPGLQFFNCIIEDKKGTIWLGGPDGIWRYDGSTLTNFTKIFVGCIYEDRNGNIWTISTPDRQSWVLSRYEAKSLSYGQPTVTEIKPEVGMFFAMLEALDGSIWLGAFGVYRYDGNTVTKM